VPRAFYQLLGNTIAATFTNTTVWFALTYTVYLETRSVLAASVLSGVYMVAELASGFWFGSLVDRYRKRSVLIASGVVSLVIYALGFALYQGAPDGAFSDPRSTTLWAFILLLLVGVIAGNVRSIALPVIITALIPEGRRDRANGLAGASTGIAVVAVSAVSGVLVGHSGMHWVLILAMGMMAATSMHLLTVPMSEPAIVHVDGRPPRLDIRGTLAVVGAVPGLAALIGFSSFNNFLAGVYTVLLDPYGLSLMSVQAWGLSWALFSLAVMVGGLIIARWGLGRNPLLALFMANLGIWVVSSLFAIRPSVVLLIAGIFIYSGLVPFIEAAEHTIMQKVVPHERQGRAFGFAQSVEAAASPVTTFLFGPIAELAFIPFMTTGAGARTIGGWFGTGPDRGMALLFCVTGVVGLAVTLVAMRTRAYRRLSRSYADPSFSPHRGEN
jgi:DHA3 family multidrug efflux protein-like MFS transporter